MQNEVEMLAEWIGCQQLVLSSLRGIRTYPVLLRLIRLTVKL